MDYARRVSYTLARIEALVKDSELGAEFACGVSSCPARLVMFLTARSVGRGSIRGSLGFGASLSQEEHKIAGGHLHVRWLRSGQRDLSYTRNSS